MNWREHISVDPKICHGRVCIAGTRVMVSVVLDNLAACEPVADIAQNYRISTEDIQVALEYAAEVVRERIVPFTAGAA